MHSRALAQLNLPAAPGVYFFRKGREILYIGKATSLRDRVRSYFGADLIATRGPLLVDMVTQAEKVTFEETDSVLEALLLEANLIKKHQPRYNTREKDDKSFASVVITGDEWPRVLLVRARNIAMEAEAKRLNAKHVFGPYPNGGAIRDALKIVRRIFPFIDEQSAKRDNAEFYRQLGLSPEVGLVGARDAYLENVRHLRLFFQGKKKTVIRELKRAMALAATELRFERAAELKRQIFSLEHINDVALIKRDRLESLSKAFRIEAYDIAHLSGKQLVGVMTAVADGAPDKSMYRKFIIRGQAGADDTKALEEVLRRRFKHSEWEYPAIIAIDGGPAQLNAGRRVMEDLRIGIPVVSVVKDDRHKAREILGAADVIAGQEAAITLANAEAHRFAISFHRKKRDDAFLPSK